MIPSASPGATPLSSPRVRLARVALAAALSEPGVVAGHAGRARLHQTKDGATVLIGVTAAAQADGRYALDLHLLTRPVPLHALADVVTRKIHSAAARQGLSAMLGSVSIVFEDVVDAGA